MKTILSLLTGLALFFIVENSNAQSPLSWEIRTGIDVATQKLGDADLNTGFGFDGVLTYRFMPHTSAFAGWGWHRFSSDDSFAGSDFDFEETGYTFGLEFMHPISSSPVDFYIKGGGIYNHIEVENSDGDITTDSEHGLGWQLETGVALSLGNRWLLKPGIRYRSLSRDIEVGTTSVDTDLTYFNFGVGLSRTF